MTKRFNPPSPHRIGAVAIAAALAAITGVAAAQSSAPRGPSGFVVDSRGNVVRSAYSECVRPGQSAAPSSTPCPTPVRTASTTGTTRTASAAAPAAAQSAGTGATAPGAPSRLPGYAVSSDGRVVLNGFGTCVRAGHWHPSNAAEPCDRVTVAQVAPPPAPVAAAPEPKLEPAPAPKIEPAPLAQPVPAPEPPRPVIQKVTLSTDVLFDFNSAELKEGGKKRLDELANQVKDANVDEIIAIGHADRIASEDYNKKLSEARAQAVRDYLQGKVTNARAVTAEGKGESQPVTGEDCKKMGPETGANKKLVACLQPDRRVEIEVLGSRQVAGGAPAAGSGTTGAGTTGGGSSSGSSAAPAGGGSTTR